MVEFLPKRRRSSFPGCKRFVTPIDVSLRRVESKDRNPTAHDTQGSVAPWSNPLRSPKSLRPPLDLTSSGPGPGQSRLVRRRVKEVDLLPDCQSRRRIPVTFEESCLGPCTLPWRLRNRYSDKSITSIGSEHVTSALVEVHCLYPGLRP